MIIREIQESELADLLRLYGHLHAPDDPLPAQDAVEAIWRGIQENPDASRFCSSLLDVEREIEKHRTSG